MKIFEKQVAAARKSSVIVTIAGKRGRYFNKTGKGEMPISHKIESSHQQQEEQQHFTKKNLKFSTD